MYKFLLKPGWLALHVGAFVLAVLMVGLGFWQLNRLEQRQTRNALIESRYEAEPLPLADLIASDEAIEFRPAQVTGSYDTEREVLQRVAVNYNGEPGYYLLTPLILEGAQAVIVKRGWVPFELNTPPVAEATPPQGEVEVVGLVRETFPPPSGFLAALAAQDPPGDLSITAYVDTERLEQQLPYELLPYYLELREQTPASGRLPLPVPEPELTDGSHLGYAIQWFAFALIGVLGYGFLLRSLARARAKPSNNSAVNSEPVSNTRQKS